MARQHVLGINGLDSVVVVHLISIIDDRAGYNEVLQWQNIDERWNSRVSVEVVPESDF